MEIKLIAFSFCWLLAIAHSSPRIFPSVDLEEEIYDLSPEEADNFFRFLLLSKYGIDTSDYPVPDQVLDDEEQPMSFIADEKPMSFGVEDKPVDFDAKNPMDFDAEEKLLSFDTDEMPFGSEGLAFDDNNLGKSVLPIRQAVQKIREEQSTTITPPQNEVSTEDASSTTSAPDVLASMPPVVADKGQKEFVMLRPPTDNHRKIEHWMEEMANNLGMQDNTEQKKRYAM